MIPQTPSPQIFKARGFAPKVFRTFLPVVLAGCSQIATVKQHEAVYVASGRPERYRPRKVHWGRPENRISPSHSRPWARI